MQKESSKKVQLHLGCGERYIPGFTHIDARKFPHVDYIARVDRLNMFGENSVDLIYACHLLEHFKRGEIGGTLQEWHRALKPGGILRLAVPDFEQLVKVYRATKDIKLVLGPLVGRQDYPENIHYIIFDYALLAEFLRNAGFKKVRRYDWRKTIHKNYDDFSQAYIPHMDKENGTLISLNVEATK